MFTTDLLLSHLRWRDDLICPKIQLHRCLTPGWFQEDSRMILGWFQSAAMMIPWLFQADSSLNQGRSQGDSRSIPGWFQSASMIIPGVFQSKSWSIPGWFQAGPFYVDWRSLSDERWDVFNHERTSTFPWGGSLWALLVSCHSSPTCTSSEPSFGIAAPYVFLFLTRSGKYDFHPTVAFPLNLFEKFGHSLWLPSGNCLLSSLIQ